MAKDLRHVRIGLRVDARLHAIAGNVGVHHVPISHERHLRRKLESGNARTLLPAVNGHFTVTRIDTRAQDVRITVDRFLGKVAILHKHGSHHHARGAGIDQPIKRLERTDAAAHFHFQLRLLRNLLDDADIGRLSRARAIKVDHMNPCRTGILEGKRLFKRAIVVNGHPVVVALRETHNLATQDVNGGKQIHDALPLSLAWLCARRRIQ